jgi:hypothetical protein
MKIEPWNFGKTLADTSKFTDIASDLGKFRIAVEWI